MNNAYGLLSGNRPANNKASGSSSRMIFGVVFIIAAIVGLYYLYQFLYSSSSQQVSVPLLSGLVDSTKTVVDPNLATNSAVGITQLTGVTSGGQYTANFWVYVTDTKGFNTITPASNKIANLLEISNRFGTSATGTLLFVGLDPTTGSLIVRQNTSDSNLLTSSGTTDPITGILTSAYSPTAPDTRCDLINGVEYQRWVFVNVVCNGRTLDVYLDGKLARSCVYNSGSQLGTSSGKATGYVGLNNGGNLKGYFSSANFYSYALTPDAIWSMYQAGPGTANSSIISYFKNLFNINVTFGSS